MTSRILEDAEEGAGVEGFEGNLRPFEIDVVVDCLVEERRKGVFDWVAEK